MLSKPEIQFVQSLHQKKFRQIYHKFIAEGDKTAREVLAQDKFGVHALFAQPHWLEQNAALIESKGILAREVTEGEMKKISALVSPSEALVVLQDAPSDALHSSPFTLHSKFSITLDGIRDPGNLGTLIRIADWFGIKNVFCSPDCADLRSPKVVQSTMGSFLRVNAVETELGALFQQYPQVPVFGAVLDGQPIYSVDFSSGGFLLLGNESQGIRPEWQDFISTKITIPRVGEAESLNAAVAGGIICAVAAGRFLM